MALHYLEFERPIAELEAKIEELHKLSETAGPGALLSDARKIAQKAGYDTANYDRDIVSHTSVAGFDWGGLGVVGGKGTWLQSYGTGVTAHELGHNQGLRHANFWNPDAAYTGIYGTGTNIEYGNIFDTMGSGGSHFGALFKNQLDWLPDTAPDPARNRLISLALRPAPVTDQWIEEGPALGPLIPATHGLTLIEAAQPAEPGQQRAVLEPGQEVGEVLHPHLAQRPGRRGAERRRRDEGECAAAHRACVHRVLPWAVRTSVRITGTVSRRGRVPLGGRSAGG